MPAILVVSINDQRLGLRVADVVEVVWAVAHTPLPGAPSIVEGLIHVRGVVIPLLDVRIRFGHPTRPVDLSDRFIVVEAAGRSVALHVDHADSVIDVEEDAIAAADVFGPPPRGIGGVATLPDGLLLIQDLTTFLSETEISLLDDALSSSSARGSA